MNERVKNIPSILILTALAVATFLVWRAAFSASDGKLHITFLDVGSADAVLIQTPSGRHVLVNGGASNSLLSNELGRRLPFSRKLDWRQWVRQRPVLAVALAFGAGALLGGWRPGFRRKSA